jgi:hypothetical protein
LVHSKKFIALDGGRTITLDAAKEVGTAVVPMVIYCRRLNFVIVHCLFVILRAAEKK